MKISRLFATGPAQLVLLVVFQPSVAMAKSSFIDAMAGPSFLSDQNLYSENIETITVGGKMTRKLARAAQAHRILEFGKLLLNYIY